MVSALVLIADGSEEIEFSTAYDILVRVGVDVKSIGVDLADSSFAAGSRHIKIIPDHPSISNVGSLPLADALILPGGLPGSKNFRGSRAVIDLINEYHQAGKLVCSICAATIVVVESGEENGWKARVTSHPAVKQEVLDKGWEYAPDSERVVVDEKERVISSRGPGTAMGWALKIATILVGEEKVKEISKPLILAGEL